MYFIFFLKPSGPFVRVFNALRLFLLNSLVIDLRHFIEYIWLSFYLRHANKEHCLRFLKRISKESRHSIIPWIWQIFRIQRMSLFFKLPHSIILHWLILLSHESFSYPHIFVISIFSFPLSVQSLSHFTVRPSSTVSVQCAYVFQLLFPWDHLPFRWTNMFWPKGFGQSSCFSSFSMAGQFTLPIALLCLPSRPHHILHIKRSGCGNCV
jgi:hypothetical protein